MKMLANFDERLDIDDDPRKVRAAGPIHWENIPQAIQEVRVKATIKQGKAEGTDTSEPFRRGAGRWWCDVESHDDPFHAAQNVPATGWVVIDGQEPWPWKATPELVDP